MAMENLPGFRLNEQLHEGRHTLVYRGVRISDEIPVVVKLLKSEYPTGEQLSKFRREFEIGKQVDNEYVVRPISFEKHGNGLALVLEDFGGVSLKEIIKNHKVSSKAFLTIARKVSQALGVIHSAGIIHKDIKPGNIIVNSQTGKVKLTDFGISTLQTREPSEFAAASHLEGTLAYISPEQTGRMNRAVDSRSDLYSAGATFYEMLTGRPPFAESQDDMALIHAHIALQPGSPGELNPKIEPALSAVILKLLSKNAEDRYQTGVGLRADLDKCLHLLQTKGVIEDFKLGEQDVSDRLQIPQTLYGRDTEATLLTNNLNAVVGGPPRLIAVSGPAGIGKSSLVNDLQKPVAEKHGYFASGKFDQFTTDVPFAGLVGAFQELLKQILTEPEAQIAAFRQKLQASLGDSAKVITDIIPNLELILGKQKEVESLAPAEAENRFNSLFVRFTQCFTSPTQPLVIFLDDMHWADRSSVRLLERILTDLEMRSLMAITAYREQDLPSDHALRALFDNLKSENITTERVTLGALEIRSLTTMISETFSLSSGEAQPLTAAVIQKTNGNPFFTREFLKTLNEEGAIRFDISEGKWRWDSAKIQSASITDNVVELMSAKIRGLKPASQELLQTAACIGAIFDVSTLTAVSGLPAEKVNEAIGQPLKEGLIIAAAADVRITQEEITSGSDRELNQHYKFLHDRVQQASYDLLQPEERAVRHYAVGRYWRHKFSSTEQSERVIEIANQLNFGINLQSRSDSESLEIAELNLAAARRARNATAYDSALRYVNNAIQLLPANAWKNNYELARDVYTEGAGVNFLCDNFEQGEQLGDLVIKNVKTPLEKVTIYRERIPFYNGRQEYAKALDTAVFPILRELGVKLPSNPIKLQIPLHLVRTRLAQGLRSTASLVNAPELTDRRVLAAQEILSNSVTSASFGRPNAYPMIILAQVRLGHQHGSSPEYAAFLSALGLVYIGILGNLPGGSAYAEAGLKLMERYPHAKAATAKMDLVQGYFLRPWKYPFEDSQKYLEEGYHVATAAGDYEYMVFCHTTHIMVEFLRGRVALADLAPRARQYDAEAVRLKQQNGRGYFMPVAQLILNLSGSSDHPEELRGDIFDYERDIPKFITQNNVIAVFHSHIVRSFTALLFGDYVIAESEAEHASKYLEANPAGQYLIVLAFSHAMSSLALAGSGAPSERGRRLRNASRIIKQMKKWADFNDDNFGAFYRIAIAERERVQGSDSRAVHLFDEAINHARDKGFLNLEAFANELVGKFHMQRGSEKSARPYIADARYAYMRWGAAAKVRDIDARFEEMVRKIVAADKLASQTRGDTLTRTASMTSTASGETTGSSFDINTVTKAVQALSGEIFLDKLLRKMMEILIQNAGAEKAILMLEKDGKFYIEAEASTQNNHPSILQSVPVDSDALAPLAIVEYVRRTNEAVVLGNAVQEGLFTRSLYVQEHKTKSVICSPITQRGKLFGMIYLENNLATNAFTGGRIEIVRILTTQAAISLENARLVAEETERQKLQKEMEMAKQVQMSILPRFVEDEAYRITAHMTPADQVGGDYYDFYNINGKRWIAIGDVTGHGMNSGLMMLMAQTGFSTYLNSTSNPDILEGFSAINKTLHMNMKDRTKQELYMTFTALSADNDGNFEHVGKHEDILVYRKSTGKVETVKSDGFWMGLVPDVKPMLAKAAFSLNSGDFITLFTDGVIEGRSATGEQFDTHRLISTIEAFAAEGIERVKDEIVNACFQWMDKQDDDLTLFIMQKK